MAGAVRVRSSWPWRDPPSADDQARRGRLVVTVADQTERRHPERDGDGHAPGHGAARRAAHRAGVTPATRASPSSDGLADGRYTIQVEFPGFATSILQDVRVRGGDTRRRITLQLQQARRSGHRQPRPRSRRRSIPGSAFSTVLTREQIDALPDDPGRDGSGAQGDGAAGFDDPRGRLHRRQAAAEVADPIDPPAADGHVRRAEPRRHDGHDVHRHHDDARQRAAARQRRLQLHGRRVQRAQRVHADEGRRAAAAGTASSLSGTIKPNRTSFSINGGGGSQYSSPNLLAVLPDGTHGDRHDAAAARQLQRQRAARSRDQQGPRRCARASTATPATSRNLGVGGYNLFDRAFDTEASTNIAAPVGERADRPADVHRVAPAAAVERAPTATSAVEAPTIRVQDAFTSGGAQQRGGRNSLRRRARHRPRLRQGRALVAHGRAGRRRPLPVRRHRRTTSAPTRSRSLADYEAGRAVNFTRRTGDPTITLLERTRRAVYLQDDWRVTRSLLRLAGRALRRAERTSATAGTCRRASRRRGRRAQRQHSRSAAATATSTTGSRATSTSRRCSSTAYRQREINIFNPSYPDPGTDGEARRRPTGTSGPTTSLLPSAHRMTAGVEQDAHEERPAERELLARLGPQRCCAAAT